MIGLKQNRIVRHETKNIQIKSRVYDLKQIRHHPSYIRHKNYAKERLIIKSTKRRKSRTTAGMDDAPGRPIFTRLYETESRNMIFLPVCKRLNWLLRLRLQPVDQVGVDAAIIFCGYLGNSTGNGTGSADGRRQRPIISKSNSDIKGY